MVVDGMFQKALNPEPASTLGNRGRILILDVYKRQHPGASPWVNPNLEPARTGGEGREIQSERIKDNEPEIRRDVYKRQSERTVGVRFPFPAPFNL